MYLTIRGLFYHISVFIVPAMVCCFISTSSAQVKIDLFDFYNFVCLLVKARLAYIGFSLFCWVLRRRLRSSFLKII